MTLRDEDEAPSWWAGTHGKLLLVGLLIALLLALIGTYIALDGARYLTLEAIRARQSQLELLYAAHPWSVTAAFFGAYVTMAALSLPGATLLTLIAGAIFGVLAGTLLVSFASAIGATFAFLASRYLFRDVVERRFAVRMAEIDRGIEKDGAFYLFMLRLVPIVPFFVINLLMGLTRLRVGVFYVVTQVAMLGGTAVYVNAGTRLARTESLSDIVSPVLLISFALLGIFPWLAKRLVEGHGRRKLHARWRRPRRFERNLVVIGGGVAAEEASRAAVASGAAVTLVRHAFEDGEDAAPSQARLRLAMLRQQAREARRAGAAGLEARLDFPALMQRIECAAAAASQHAAEHDLALGIEVREGQAFIVDPWRVAISAPDGRSDIVTTRSIVIAAGTEPLLPDLPGLDEVECVTSDTVWALRVLPRRLVVLGGGGLGCELAQCFARLGSSVVMVVRGERLLAQEDGDIAERVHAALAADGVKVLAGHRALRCERETHHVAVEQWLVVDAGGSEERIAFDCLLCVLGRRPRLDGYGLEELGVLSTASGGLDVDAWLQTLYPNIYAAGGVIGTEEDSQLAEQEGRRAAGNALFGGLCRHKVDKRFMPRTILVDPEVAVVGLDEQSAREQGVAYEVTTFDVAGLDRALADGAHLDRAMVDAGGIAKVLAVPGRDRILGVAIVAAQAAERLAEFVLAMQQRIGLERVLHAARLHPNGSEGSPTMADARQSGQRAGWLLRWTRRYHAWRRR